MQVVLAAVDYSLPATDLRQKLDPVAGGQSELPAADALQARKLTCCRSARTGSRGRNGTPSLHGSAFRAPLQRARETRSVALTVVRLEIDFPRPLLPILVIYLLIYQFIYIYIFFFLSLNIYIRPQCSSARTIPARFRQTTQLPSLTGGRRGEGVCGMEGQTRLLCTDGSWSFPADRPSVSTITGGRLARLPPSQLWPVKAGGPSNPSSRRWRGSQPTADSNDRRQTADCRTRDSTPTHNHADNACTHNGHARSGHPSSQLPSM